LDVLCASSPITVSAITLFLKNKSDADRFDEEVLEFFHEGPEINRVTEDVETLLGLKDRPASTDAYPKAVYETGELVQVGDRVQVKASAVRRQG
jgi:hypothetical protein